MTERLNRMKCVMVKINKELGMVNYVKHEKDKQIKVIKRVDRDLKDEEKKINSYRNMIKHHINNKEKESKGL